MAVTVSPLRPDDQPVSSCGLEELVLWVWLIGHWGTRQRPGCLTAGRRPLIWPKLRRFVAESKSVKVDRPGTALNARDYGHFHYSTCPCAPLWFQIPVRGYEMTPEQFSGVGLRSAVCENESLPIKLEHPLRNQSD